MEPVLNFVDKEVMKNSMTFWDNIDSIYEFLPEVFTKEELYNILNKV